MKVIFVVADSLRRDHLGCYGNEWIVTPHIDAFAKDCALFENAYTGSFPTLPNRTDLFTGRFGFPWRGWAPLERTDVVVAQVLGDNGVPSMLINDTPHMCKEAYYYQRGFTAYDWSRGQEYDPLVLDHSTPIEYTCDPKKLRDGEGRHKQIILNSAHRRVETDWICPRTYTKAIDWLCLNRNREDFLLWLDGFDPHEPWDPPQWYTDLYDPGYKGEVVDCPWYGENTLVTKREAQHTQALYAGEVTMVDTWFGRLLDTLKLTGIYDDALVVFTTDHGHYLCRDNDHNMFGKFMLKPIPPKLKGRRPTPDDWQPLYDSITHIPLLVKFPKALGAGKRMRQIVQPCDLSATILDALKIKPPKTFHGRSILPMVKGKARKIRDFAITAYHGNLLQYCDATWHYTTFEKHRPAMLHNIEDDPDMNRDLKRAHPAMAKKLHNRVIEFLMSIECPGEQLALYEA